MDDSDEKRLLYFGARGLRSQLVEIAPEDPALVPSSKRKDIIFEEDVALDKNLNELDDGTRRRNRAFQERLDEVWSSMAGWEAKLKTESIEAVETITQMRADYQKQIDNFTEVLKSEIATIFDKFDNELEPEQTQRVIEEENALDVFVQKTVPEALDRQTGELSRKLKKAYETFEIEQQKEQKREMKFVQKANEHIQRTAQRFHDEAALQDSCFFNLEDDVIEHERRSIRMQYRRVDSATRNIDKINRTFSREGKFRENEDLEVLDTVIETQQLLQKTVILHFGADQDRDIESMSIRFPKLEKRMELQQSRRNSAAAMDEHIE